MSQDMWYAPRYMLSRLESVWRRLWGWTPLYWLRCHTFTRYHIIDIRGQDDYKWGWIDRSHAMYLACFTLLVDFVEKEDPTVGLRTEANYRGDPDMIDDDEWNQYHKPSIDYQLANEREIRALYDWWKLTRKQEWDACYAIHKDIHNPFRKIEGSNTSVFEPNTSPEHDAWMEEYDRLEAKDEEMLGRLIKIRQCLWT
jgi:hypothetical protein